MNTPDSLSNEDEALENLVAQALEVLATQPTVDWSALAPNQPELVAKAQAVLSHNDGLVGALFATRNPSLDYPKSREAQRLSKQPDGQTSSQDRPAPAALAGFILGDLLGAGGMGTVYRARQTSLQRDVALKLVDLRTIGDHVSRLRFRREAELTASLEHPSIVPVHAVGEEAGFAWLAMKLLSGPSLDRLELPLAPSVVAEYGVAIAEAMEAAHCAGVIHRDIKPGNILLDQGRPCVIDFGLAKSRTDATLTAAGALPGTLAYMAPELLGGETKTFDQGTDIYALGVTLYQLAAGRLPFPSDDAVELARKALLLDAPTLGLPARHRDLETIILRATARDRGRRFVSMTDFGADLRRYLEGRPIRSRRLGVLRRLLARARRRPKLAAMQAALGLFLVSALGFVIWTIRLNTEEQQQREARAIRAVEAGDGADAMDALGNFPERRDGEVAQRVEARNYLDTAIDYIAQPREGTSRSELKRVPELMNSEGVQRWYPWPARGVLVLLAWHEERFEDAQSILRELQDRHPGIMSECLNELLTDGLVEAAAIGDSPTPEDELVIAAVALKRANAPAHRVSEILSPARQSQWPMIARLRAINAAERGNYGEARALLQGLMRPEGTPREIVRNLAKVNARLGHYREAHHILVSLHRDTWTASEVALWFDIGSHLDAATLVPDRVAQISGNPILREDPAVLRVLAESGVGKLPESEVRALIAQARAEGPSKGVADLLTIVELKLTDRSLPPPQLPAAPGQGLNPLLDLGICAEAQRLARESRFADLRGRALWMFARSLVRLGKPARAFATLRTAIANSPDLVEARLELLALVHDAIAQSDQRTEWRNYFSDLDARLAASGGWSSYVLMVAEARSVARGTITGHQDRRWSLAPSQLELLGQVSAALAHQSIPDASLIEAVAALGEGISSSDSRMDKLAEHAQAIAITQSALLLEDAWSRDDRELVPILEAER